jgi:hypothetical protein
MPSLKLVKNTAASTEVSAINFFSLPAVIFIDNCVFMTAQYTERLYRVQRTLQSTVSLHIFTTIEQMNGVVIRYSERREQTKIEHQV